jgi:hypothetical protein
MLGWNWLFGNFPNSSTQNLLVKMFYRWKCCNVPERLRRINSEPSLKLLCPLGSAKLISGKPDADNGIQTTPTRFVLHLNLLDVCFAVEILLL